MENYNISAIFSAFLMWNNFSATFSFFGFGFLIAGKLERSEELGIGFFRLYEFANIFLSQCLKCYKSQQILAPWKSALQIPSAFTLWMVLNGPSFEFPQRHFRSTNIKKKIKSNLYIFIYLALKSRSIILKFLTFFFINHWKSPLTLNIKSGV